LTGRSLRRKPPQIRVAPANRFLDRPNAGSFAEMAPSIARSTRDPSDFDGCDRPIDASAT
jgi:hypothetical protein